MKLVDIIIISSTITANNESKRKALGSSTISRCNQGKGTIIDSGTTDTYLPSAMRKPFIDTFNELSNGIRYTNTQIQLTEIQLHTLPTIIYRFEGMNGDIIDIPCPPTSYAEKISPGRYAFRIYLTEG